MRQGKVKQLRDFIKSHEMRYFVEHNDYSGHMLIKKAFKVEIENNAEYWVYFVCGNTAEFTHNHRLVCELQYAQKRFHINGSESPDPEFAAILQSYVSQLQLMQDRENRVPDHIDALFQERYGFHYNRE